MSRTARPGAAAAAVLAAVLVGAPTAAQAFPWPAAPSHGGESAATEPPAGEDHHAGQGDHGVAAPTPGADDHGDHGAPAPTRGADDHGDHGAAAPTPGADDHGDHGAAGSDDHGDHGAPAPTPGADDHGDHGAAGSDDHGAAGSDDHGAVGSDDHGEESGGGHGADPDTVTPETRRIVLSGFGGLNAAVLTAAFLFRLRDRRTGRPLHSGRRAQR